MNRLLADTLGALNTVLALAIIAIGFVVGFAAGGKENGAFIFLFSVILSFLAAVLICGMLALFIDIKNSNREILQLLKQQKAPLPPDRF